MFILLHKEANSTHLSRLGSGHSVSRVFYVRKLRRQIVSESNSSFTLNCCGTIERLRNRTVSSLCLFLHRLNGANACLRDLFGGLRIVNWKKNGTLLELSYFLGFLPAIFYLENPLHPVAFHLWVHIGENHHILYKVGFHLCRLVNSVSFRSLRKLHEGRECSLCLFIPLIELRRTLSLQERT